MTHLEEGTIHAWLDGALSAAEAREAQSHVDACAECSAKVAEARGFIAGASRILTALDDVPAGVTPKRAPSTAPAIRQWRAAPWVTGIAATLILAIGVRTFTRTGVPTKLGERAATSLDSTVPVGASTPEAARATPAPAPATVASARRAAALGGLGSRVAARAAAPERGEPIVARDTAQDRKKALADLGAGQPLAAAPAAAFKDAPSTDVVAKLENARDLAGCYPIEEPPVLQGFRGAAANAAGKATATSPRPQAAPAPTAAINRASESEPMPAPPPIVLLDTTSSRVGFIARSPETRVALGFWSRVGDSVRVDLLARGLYTIAASKRTNCP